MYLLHFHLNYIHPFIQQNGNQKLFLNLVMDIIPSPRNGKRPQQSLRRVFEKEKNIST